MHGHQFRLKTPVLAILQQDGQKLPVTLPQGAVVEVVHGPLNGHRVVDVTWEGKTVMVFTIDLHDCGERVNGNGA